MQYVISVLTVFSCAAILTVNVGQFETTSIEVGVDSITASGDDKYNNILDTKLKRPNLRSTTTTFHL